MPQRPATPSLAGSRSGRRSPLLRQLAWAAAILAIAAGVGWLAERRDARRLEDVAVMVRELCWSASELSSRSPVEPAILDDVGRELGRVRAMAVGAGGPDALGVDVLAGDAAAFDGSATHHARLLVEGEFELGLRMVETGPGAAVPARIVGYWTEPMD